MGAVFAVMAALLLFVAPATHATTSSPTPSPSASPSQANETFTNNISGFLRDDARAPLADVKITATGERV